MTVLLILLFLPALFCWVRALVYAIRAYYGVRLNRQVEALFNPLIIFSDALSRQVFDEKGLNARREALRSILWFLMYCVFLFVVLLLLPRAN
ncbi:MAG: hypothetical protein AB3N23_08470 [Paracoccaceae bacterium]